MQTGTATGLRNRVFLGSNPSGATSTRDVTGKRVGLKIRILWVRIPPGGHWHPYLAIHRQNKHIMSLISLIVAIVVVGLLLWAINSFIPMEERIKKILNVVVIIILILWILQAFGVWGYLSGVKI